MAYQSQLGLMHQFFQHIPTRKPFWTWETILYVHLPAQRANTQRDPRFSGAINPDFIQYRAELQIWRNLWNQPGVGGPPFPGIAPPMHLPPATHYYQNTIIYPPSPPPPEYPIPPQSEPTIRLPPPPPPQSPQPTAAAPATTSLPPETAALPPAYPPPLTDPGSVPVVRVPWEPTWFNQDAGATRDERRRRVDAWLLTSFHELYPAHNIRSLDDLADRIGKWLREQGGLVTYFGERRRAQEEHSEGQEVVDQGEEEKDGEDGGVKL